MENKKNIYEKLFEVKKSWIKLQRDTKAFNYKYATLNQIQEKLNPYLEENKLLILHKVIENKVITEIVNIENTEEKIFSEINMAENTKAQDKGSEITYYRRYNLLSLLDLETEDDDWKKAQNSWVKSENNNDEKPWFSEENFKALWQVLEKFNSWDEILAKAREKYKVSKVWAEKIKNLI